MKGNRMDELERKITKWEEKEQREKAEENKNGGTKCE